EWMDWSKIKASEYEELRTEQKENSKKYCLEIGVNYAKKQKLREAIKYYQYALQWDERYTDAMVAKAAALTHLLQYDEAEQVLTQAINIDADTPNAAQYLTVVLQRKECVFMLTFFVLFCFKEKLRESQRQEHEINDKIKELSHRLVGGDDKADDKSDVVHTSTALKLQQRKKLHQITQLLITDSEDDTM
ncbi:hypothetical protein RFI_15032, partial [Reticulomyxa filosa]